MNLSHRAQRKIKAYLSGNLPETVIVVKADAEIISREQIEEFATAYVEKHTFVTVPGNWKSSRLLAGVHATKVGDEWLIKLVSVPPPVNIALPMSLLPVEKVLAWRLTMPSEPVRTKEKNETKKDG